MSNVQTCLMKISSQALTMRKRMMVNNTTMRKGMKQWFVGQCRTFYVGIVGLKFRTFDHECPEKQENK